MVFTWYRVGAASGNFGLRLLHGLTTKGFGAIVLLLSIYPYFSTFSAENTSRPNIIFILADDLG
jgi:hypothetical protein